MLDAGRPGQGGPSRGGAYMPVGYQHGNIASTNKDVTINDSRHCEREVRGATGRTGVALQQLGTVLREGDTCAKV